MTDRMTDWLTGRGNERGNERTVGYEDSGQRTVLKIVCMYCGSAMGEKDGQGVSGVSHSICRECWVARFPDWEYPEDKRDNDGVRQEG